ncbi:MAG: hypothetical protein JNK87_21985 [Bryobacterales bacterium]|nr:hypothetical protein [Bryobacterales bacterium]
MADAIHIHEDDWGMRNLYPLQGLTDAMSEPRRRPVSGTVPQMVWAGQTFISSSSYPPITPRWG